MYPRILVNNGVVPAKESVVHLGHKISCDVSERHVENVIAKFYKQYNLFLSRFGRVTSYVKSLLFVTYCSSFYGVTLCDLKDIDPVLVALRKCTRRIWNISPRTHSDILPHLTGICRHMLTKRFVKYYNGALASENDTMRYMFSTAMFIQGSVTSNNIKMLCDEVGHNFLNRMELYIRCDCLEDEALGRKAAFLQELCMVRDRQLSVDLTNSDIDDIIEYLCLN